MTSTITPIAGNRGIKYVKTINLLIHRNYGNQQWPEKQISSLVCLKSCLYFSNSIPTCKWKCAPTYMYI
jgi:hypothetical protein